MSNPFFDHPILEPSGFLRAVGGQSARQCMVAACVLKKLRGGVAGSALALMVKQSVCLLAWSVIVTARCFELGRAVQPRQPLGRIGRPFGSLA